MAWNGPAEAFAGPPSRSLAALRSRSHVSHEDADSTSRHGGSRRRVCAAFVVAGVAVARGAYIRQAGRLFVCLCLVP